MQNFSLIYRRKISGNFCARYFFSLFGLCLLLPSLLFAEEVGNIRNLLQLEDSNISDEVLPAGLSRAYIKELLATLDEKQRKELLADKKRFNELVREEAKLLSVLRVALHNKVEERADVRFLARRNVENLIRESYFKLLLASRLPEGFPDREQVETFYQDNKKLFSVGQQVHLWQVFFSVAEDTSTKEWQEASTQAKDIRDDILANKVDFATAALRYSDHIPTRSRGGYMGLLKVTDLIPEIKEQVLQLPEDQLSKPIRTEMGLHLIKRGAIIDPSEVSLDTDYDLIRNTFLIEVTKKITESIYERAQEEHPIVLSDTEIEEWRLQIRVENTAP